MKNIEINRNQKYYRILEILPGFVTWSVIIGSVLLSLYLPKLFAAFVIIYAVTWLLRALSMSARLIYGYNHYKKDIAKNWLKKCDSLKDHKKIHHLAIIPAYKESYETLDTTMQRISKSTFPLKNLIVVLGMEERAGEVDQQLAKKISDKYKNVFGKFIITTHPANIKGEVAGKGANITFAARQALKYIKEKNIPFEDVMVTTLDADNRPHEQYFACLTYKYLTADDKKHKSYQPLPMYFNNVWQVPTLIRSIAIGSTFWQIIESTREDGQRNFSAHSQPLDALIETDFWSTRTVVEDGHQFWRSYFAFDGNHSVVPINIPVYQDAVLSPRGFSYTFIEQYLQKQRWSWGCSDIPYVIINSIKNKKINFWDKSIKSLRLFEGHISWATTSIILFFAGWLPLILNPSFSDTIVALNFPYFYSRILTVAMVGILVTLTLSTIMLPPRPKRKFNWSIVFEWIITPFILPFSNILLSSIPSIHAQTLLMRGKYMGFRVTEKK